MNNNIYEEGMYVIVRTHSTRTTMSVHKSNTITRTEYHEEQKEQNEEPKKNKKNRKQNKNNKRKADDKQHLQQQLQQQAQHGTNLKS